MLLSKITRTCDRVAASMFNSLAGMFNRGRLLGGAGEWDRLNAQGAGS